MSHLTFALFGLNPTLSARARRYHDAQVSGDPKRSAAFMGKALRQGRYDLMARICGEAGYLPNHLLDMASPYLAIEIRTGLAWKTAPGGSVAIGSLFDLLELPEIAAIAETWDDERLVSVPLVHGYGQWLVEAADECLAERAWIQGTTLHMQATRYETIEILVLLLRRIGRAARQCEIIPVSDVIDTVTVSNARELA